jgi:hypothetical protein
MQAIFVYRSSVFISFFLFCFLNSNAQCCAGGSGSPIAGGASQGVLQEKQVELNSNIQYISSGRFYKGSTLAPDSARTFDSFSSLYQYFRLAYGVTRNLTFSIESGYYWRKKEVGLNADPATTYESKGIGDLIIFPRYDVINWTEEKYRTELTLGLGIKLPLGSYNDSVKRIEPFSGQSYYLTKPTSVQLSSGAQDIILYGFFYRGFTQTNFKVFANTIYIRKGYNANGEKAGNFLSTGLFAGKSFKDHFGTLLQLRVERLGRMQVNEAVLMFGRPSNYYPEATGYTKVFITPQVSYTRGKITTYASIDIPIYQKLNSSEFYTQIGSQLQTTFGISYRFFALKHQKVEGTSGGQYSCPMHPEETSDQPGACPKCGMELEKKK